MAKSSLKLKVGGVSRDIRIEIGLAPKLEAATGLGVIALARQLQDFSCTTSTVGEVLRTALAANGAVYSSEEVFGLIEHDGLLPSYRSAGIIVAALFGAPDVKSAGKKQPAEGGQTQTSSH